MTSWLQCLQVRPGSVKRRMPVQFETPPRIVFYPGVGHWIQVIIGNSVEAPTLHLRRAPSVYTRIFVHRLSWLSKKRCDRTPEIHLLRIISSIIHISVCICDHGHGRAHTRIGNALCSIVVGVANFAITYVFSPCLM